jgi:hypothetical protein
MSFGAMHDDVTHAHLHIQWVISKLILVLVLGVSVSFSFNFYP